MIDQGSPQCPCGFGVLGIALKRALSCSNSCCVYSPQYWLWVLLLAGFPRWLAAVFAVAFADFVVGFSSLHLQSDRVWPQVDWFSHAIFWPMVDLRYSGLLTCAAWGLSRALGRDQARPDRPRSSPQVSH